MDAPNASQLKAVVHGLVARESHALFPARCPSHPRLFEATRAFLERLATHRSTAGHHVDCPACRGVEVVLAFIHRARDQAVERGDETTALVLARVDQTLAEAWGRQI